MHREYISFSVTDTETIKIKMLNWLKRFNIFCFLDNNQYQLSHHSIELVAGAGAMHMLQAPAGTALEQLRHFNNLHANDWRFGHLAYDLKNEIESLTSEHADSVKFPDLFFFVPEIFVRLSKTELTIGTCNGDAKLIFDELQSTAGVIKKKPSRASIETRFSREEYVAAVKALQWHIVRGDCYEVNFCQEFYDNNCEIDPYYVFDALSRSSPNPFAAFYKIHDKYLICASPERYLKKEGNSIFSQPIKGTSQRNLASAEMDEESRAKLLASEKERSENVMVVDLVRNDLSKFCAEGSVKVEELFGIYSFPQVHQMISTVRGELKSGVDAVEMIRSTFPMGSMTGAPKKRVMQLIEQYERTRRGLFSGAVGYFAPDGDFDLNVVIRSILYNEELKYLSFQTGSAITFYADPEKEYEECQLKSQAIKKVLSI